MTRLACAVGLCLLLTNCASYASFVKSAEEHGVNSCFEYTIALGNPLWGGYGTIHGYTGTGANNVLECIGAITGQRAPVGVRVKQCAGDQCTHIEVQ